MKNLKILLAVVIEGGNVAEDILKETSPTKKLMALMPMADEVVALKDLSLDGLKDDVNKFKMDDAAKHEVYAFAKAKFDLDDDILEKKIESSLELIDEGFDFFVKVKSFVKAFKE